MRRRVDKEILRGFVEEAQSYLPRVLRIVEASSSNGVDAEALREAHRLLHSIKGAAAMIGLTPLAHVALLPEELVEEMMEERQALTGEAAGLVQLAVDAIDQYLDEIGEGPLDDRALLRSVVIPFRRFRGLPEDEDHAEIERLLEPETGGDVLAAAGDLSLEDVEGVDAFEPPETTDEAGELLGVFLEEAEEHLLNLAESLREIEEHPDPNHLLGEMRRVVHTLKGSAGVVGLTELSRVAHRTEDLLQGLYEGALAVDAPTLDLLQTSHQLLEDLADRDADVEALQPQITGLFDRYDAILPRADRREPEASGSEEEAANLSMPVDGFVEFDALPPVSEPPPPLAELSRGERRSSVAPGRASAAAFDPARLLRIPLDRVDVLVRLVGELSVSRAIFQRAFSQLEQQVDELGLGTDRVLRIAGQLEAEREYRPTVALAAAGGASVAVPATAMPAVTGGFDPLELESYTELDRMSRQLTEAGADMGALRGQLDRTVADFDQSLDRLGRVTSEIQDRLLQLRMVPVGRLATRLRRAARRTAAEQGKRVEVRILGESIELDKTLLDELVDPLLHLVRNAVDHGIERPEARRRLGKSPTGLLQLAAYHSGPEVVLELSDDGSGLDEARLAHMAVERGLLGEAELAAMSQRDLFHLIFQPGFSTVSEVSEISGRGVGLDVVKTTVSQLKGSVTVSSVPGEGTTFRIRLPITLALARVAIVLVAGQRVAIPLAGIRQIVRREGQISDKVGDRPVLTIGDRTIPYLKLSEVLGITPSGSAEPDDRIILVMSVGDQEVALGAEQLIEGREAVVKSLGSHLHPLHGVSGATILGDGSVVLILNLLELLSDTEGSAQPAVDAGEPLPSPAGVAKEVLIVDDSLTVRRALSRIVSEAGWTPVPARDGLEALEILDDRPWPPDAILLDLEMPRMDGYQLTATLRARESHRDVPIIIVTSRSSDRHRQMAFEQGADEYLVKPLSEAALIDCIRRLATDRRGATH